MTERETIREGAEAEVEAKAAIMEEIDLIEPMVIDLMEIDHMEINPTLPSKK